ncbi:methionine synthase (B12-dependent) [Stella humosa]|uniref:Methionine synthase n=1 Tax=Stella humosa TaxID=94 RepID=A0A3N1L0X7_9PROT|nr:methionine synthase [Stella humosa]ROP84096.1 methionine synthase (B12-dependent) [Stella humosa]BBK33608.1 methionine synthase [Stella humosa]
MTDFLTALSESILLCDGAMGSRVQSLDLDTDRDYAGLENCTEILNDSRPDVVRLIHDGYLAAGADCVLTNSFGGSPVTLAEFGIAERAFELNKRAGELAHEAIEPWLAGGRPRFVLGSIGPGTRLPSLGHAPYQTLEDALAIQCAGLVAGGVDAFLIETCQDPLQIKAAVNGAKRARSEAGREDIPLIVQVTVETTGTLLVGTDIAAAATIIRALDVPVMGLNCATGPQEMSEHVRWLSQNWPGPISIQPNAGLPELVDGKTHYPLAPGDLAKWLARFIEEDGIGMVGGCCGTGNEHIAALDAMLRGRAAGGRARPAPAKRTVHWVPSLASLYGQVSLRQENAFLAIGERCNANGSKKFRELQEAGDWDGCVEMGREQQREGSHALDICTAFVGRDEIAEMTEVVTRMRGAVNTPLVIDSTETPVLEHALKLYGGKPIINSINFEDGEGHAAERLRLAKRFGAAVIALTIDEEGMAKDVDSKLRIAHRLHDFARSFGLPSSDLLFDPLTFTIATGNEDDRKLGLWTLEGIERIARELPECQIILGLSNISFGLNAASRTILNSVFLDHAMKRGMTGAIVHASKIVPLHKIPEEEVRVAEDLIYDRRREGYDPLQAFIALFENRKAAQAVKKVRSEKVEERLSQRIVDGERLGLEDDLALAMQTHKPLDIINNFLLDGMKVVGELFGAGKMQLPFVLQSAETMKRAVACLEPHMEKIEGQEKGTIVLATVKGDVHDIGKNLVDIILTNNGYKVVNLGIKQPIANILAAVGEHHADAIGMSGLLVKSTVVMRENLAEMKRNGIGVPVLLGGAALTRKYVEEDCTSIYTDGRVAYARDAFDGLDLMNKVMTGTFDGHLAQVAGKRKGRPTNTKRVLGQAAEPRAMRPVDSEEIRLRRAELHRDTPVPVPPFWGPRTIARVPVAALVPYLNDRMLYQFHWGYRKDGRTLEEFMAWAQQELKPTLKRMLDIVQQQDILLPQACYGYWRCAAEGDAVVLFGDDGATEVARFDLPRQNREGGLCIADFFRTRDQTTPDTRDVIGLQVVTVGQKASDVAREWFADNRYQDYLYLHGLGVEMAEAMAEYVHKRIRAELGFGHEDSREMDRLLQQGYRGSRYSFGYPACPNLHDQVALLRLLGGEQIGITLSDEDQLEPEQSTSAIVVHHPQAKYFSV